MWTSHGNLDLLAVNRRLETKMETTSWGGVLGSNYRFGGLG